MEKILKTIGNLIIVIVILACIPLAIPRVLGMEEYNVISGSMEPEISVGSLVFVKGIAFEELAEGDVIAFQSGASVVTHRVISIEKDTKLISTKGDANNVADFMPVAYKDVIGKVEYHVPILGNLAAWLSETIGKIVAGIILMVGILLSNIEEKKSKKTDSGVLEGDSAPSKKNKSRINPKIILALGLVIVFGSLGGFLYIYMGYQKSENLYASLNQDYVKTGTNESESWQDMLDVDINALKQINSDVIGWLYVEGTDISYPILYSGDDSTYLRTTIDKEPATAGSIFLEGYNLPDWTDSHDIIYGHNMRNLSMFGKLKFYKTEEDFYDSHKYFQIITPEGKMRFQIFSYFDTDPASWVYTVPYEDNEEFAEYITKLKNTSYKTIEAEVNSSDKVVTLSTCSTSGKRFTVHGFLIENQ
ncbi:class B sortase [Pseudobutyrivibrio sp. YE44]|uniref:class B sortase n=1 Tax=Pseudobutyrivibrio sp. YE44 TaxID=1520802 RepID=UPI00116006CD|nr:class B sortase [Pseudobutyrivibrio sp. YE44]